MFKRRRVYRAKRGRKRARRARRFVRKYPTRTRGPRTMVRTGLGFPRKMTMTLRYVDHFIITSTTGIMQTQRFSANGLFDPDITRTGHQPMYFDQVMSLYNHYHVIGSVIEVEATPDDSNEEPVFITVMIDDDTSIVPTDVSGVAEESLGKKIKMLNNGTGNVYKLRRTFSAKKTYGGSILGNTDLRGGASSNPLEQSYYDVCVQSGGSATTIVWCTFRITYTAVFTELKDVGQS